MYISIFFCAKHFWILFLFCLAGGRCQYFSLVFIVLLSPLQSVENALIEASAKGDLKRVQKLLKIEVNINYMNQVLILCKAFMCQQFFL